MLADGTPVEPVLPEAPSRPSPVALTMRWRQLAYLHWRVDPELVQARLPAGLTVDTFDGAAWIGLIPFYMRDALPPVLPPLPWVADFPETNVRTYAVAPDGRRGVYFHSLEASRLGAVLVARTAFRLPYQWASMTLRTSARRVRYVSRRRWPGPAGARTDIALRVGERIPDGEVTALDHFLSARWSYLDGRDDGRVVGVSMHHERWPLHEADVEHLDDELVAAAGYPGLAARPPDHVRFSPGVHVRGGLPRTVTRGGG